MPEVHEIDAEYSPLYGIIKFRGNDQQHFIISANKAKSHAKALRQAASMISGYDDPANEPAKNMREWLIDLAGKFERCEGA